MKSFFKYLLLVLGLLVILVVAFYFWGQQPTTDVSTHDQLLSYAAPGKQNAVSGTDSSFSVLTYNIGYLSGMTNNIAVKRDSSLFGGNLSRAQQLLDSLQPDLVCLQEIDYGSARSYQVDQEAELATTGYSYAARAVNWDKRYVPFPYWPPSMHFGKILSGQSILSKYRLDNLMVETLEPVRSDPFFYRAYYLDRLAMIVEAFIQGQPVILMNVHLEAFDAPTRLLHTRRVAALFDHYAGQFPTLLCGDFNSGPAEKDAAIWTMLRKKGVGAAALDGMGKGSYENSFDSEKPTERLDYIFYNTSRIQLLESKVVKEAGSISDHLPVFARFRLLP